MNEARENMSVVRIAMAYWLLGWYMKILFFSHYLRNYIWDFPIRHELFPAFFSHPLTANLAYALPLFFIPAILFPAITGRTGLLLANSVFLICAVILSLHSDTYNDATFLVSFWVALWMVWVTLHLDRQDENFRRHARLLALCLVAMIFLGGFTGKLTSAYWNGEVVYHTHFLSSPYWPFSWLEKVCSAEQLRSLATIVSRGIILMELFIVFCPLMSFRYVFLLIPCLMASVTIFNTWKILSVMGGLIGMLLACLVWNEQDRKMKSANDAKINA